MLPKEHERHTCMIGSEVQCPLLVVCHSEEFISENGSAYLCAKNTVFAWKAHKKREPIPMGLCTGHPDYDQLP